MFLHINFHLLQDRDYCKSLFLLAFSFIFCPLSVSVSSGIVSFLTIVKKNIRDKRTIKETSCNVNIETGADADGRDDLAQYG